MIWDLFEGGPLFQPTKNGVLDDEPHLAAIVSLIGPSPKAFLERSEKCRHYWDVEGNWIAAAPIPDQSFESRETRLEGSDKEMLLAYVRKILRWLLEERPTGDQLFEHGFFAAFLIKMMLDRSTILSRSCFCRSNE